MKKLIKLPTKKFKSLKKKIFFFFFFLIDFICQKQFIYFFDFFLKFNNSFYEQYIQFDHEDQGKCEDFVVIL